MNVLVIDFWIIYVFIYRQGLTLAGLELNCVAHTELTGTHEFVSGGLGLTVCVISLGCNRPFKNFRTKLTKNP